MSNLPQFFLVHNSLNGWLLGLARYKNSLPKPRPCLFEGIAEVGLEIALVIRKRLLAKLKEVKDELSEANTSADAARAELGGRPWATDVPTATRLKPTARLRASRGRQARAKRTTKTTPQSGTEKCAQKDLTGPTLLEISGKRGAFERSTQHHLIDVLFKDGVYEWRGTVETLSHAENGDLEPLEVRAVVA